MRIFLTFAFIGLLLTSLAHGQSSCEIPVADKITPVPIKIVEGLATLQGFDEYVVSTPPQKYRKKTLSGSVETAIFTDQACTIPLLSFASVKTESGTITGTNFVGTLNYTFNYTGGSTGTLTITMSQNTTAPWGFQFGFPGSSYFGTAGQEIIGSPNTSDWGGGQSAIHTRVANGWPGTKILGMGSIVGRHGQTGGVGATNVSAVWFNPQSAVKEDLAYSGNSSISASGAVIDSGSATGNLFSAATEALEPVSVASVTSVDDAVNRLGSSLFNPSIKTAKRNKLASNDGVVRLDPLKNFWRKITTCSLQDELEEMDTEPDAIARAVQLPSSSEWAFREQRSATDSDGNPFTFGFREVTIKAVLNTCPGRYLVKYHYERRLRANGVIEKIEPEYENVPFEKPETILEKQVTVPEGGDAYEYRITHITATNTTPCVAGTFGGGMEGLSSVHSMINLGPIDSLRVAGILFLDEETIDSSVIYSPVALKYSGNESPAVTIVRDSLGPLRQVKVPSGLANITTLETPAEGYEVAFYHSDQIGEADPETGIYALTDSPFVTRRYDNPDAGQSVPAPRLRVTEMRGQSSKVFTYVHNPATSAWSLSQGGGLLVTEEVSTTDGNGDEVKTRTLKTEAGAVSSVTATTYHTFPWAKEKISEVLDPADAALTTTWQYYDNATTDGVNYRRIKLRSDATGGWERYTYDADGRVATQVSPYLNSLPTAPDAQSRVTTTTRTALTDADGDTIDEQLTTVIDLVLGQETGRSYEIEWSSPVTLGTATFERHSDIRCVAAGASWNTTGNLTTETLRYATGDFSGRVRRIVNPDGTASLTTYTLATNGELTTVSESGAPNGTFDAITDGSRITTVTSAQGQVVQSSTQDIASTLTLEQWAATDFDDFGRPERIDYTDGTYETRDYACCGLSTSRDRQGRVTSYDYDALGRVEYVTRDGITHWTQYDADGRVKSVTRIGTDDTEIVQETNEYDIAGRLYERRDALNRLTTTVETFNIATGERTVTTTNPDLGTVIEVSARDGSPLSVGGTATAPLAYAYDYDSALGQLYTKETRIGLLGATTEWTKTYTDFAGRTVRIAYPDGATVQSFYNTLGQLQRQVDPDNVTTLYAYNTRGEQSVSAVDVNGNNTIDYAGLDRVVRTTTVFANKTVAPSTYVVQRTTTEAWETDNANTSTTVSISEQTPDGRRSWSTTRGLTTASVATYDGLGGHVIVTTAPDNKTVTQSYTAGGLMTQTVTHPTFGTLGSVAYDYDEHHRLETQTDLRNGTTTYTYHDDDQVNTVLTPDPDTTRSGPGYDAQLTTYAYDDAGRQNLVTLPDAGQVHTTYYPHGQVQRTWGTRTYPTEYTYDPQLRVKTLTTWKNFASNAGAAVTTWNYHPQRGWLDNKAYADNTGPAYAYKLSGRLLTRTWARLASTSSLPLTTTYSYTSSGDLNSIDYSDDTPDVSFTEFDRLGRPRTLTDAAGTRSLTYSTFGQSEDETYTAGPLNGLALDRTYDGYARLQTLSVPSIYTAGYDYDDASRLDTVTQGTHTAKYAYVPNSPLVESVTVKNNGTLRLTTTKVHDYLNRLGSIANTPSATPAHTVAYDYNAANQRAKATREDATFWDYGYDSLGQVDSAVKKQAGGTAIPGHAYGFLFDDIGNRQTATFNGTTTTYAPNDLNQYDERTVPGVIEVLGDANPAATITYTIGTGLPQPVTRQGGLFHAQATVDNSTAPVTTALTVTGVRNAIGPDGEDAVTAFTRTVFTPQTPEAYDYDTDGNLRADALWSYAWDAENRLKSMETSASAVTAGRPRVKHEYAYDGQGRRFAKKTYSWDSGAWVLTASRLFVYDGWNLLAELDWNPSTSTFILNSTFTWGLDLSGSMQGAGGVGGLLWLNAGTATHATGYDGNGNVIALVDLADGSTSATYEYGPFGDTLKADGPAAALNPYRFSTKFTDESGLLYYGLRYYNPSTGRWLGRDPIEESGGLNLYGMVGNDPISFIDPLGLALYAFDGTKNDGYKQEADGNETNVYILQKDYRGNKKYLPGVGTNDGFMNLLGLAFGYGGQSRIREMLDAAGGFIAQGDLVADIIGFSRGAAQARDFANKLKGKYPCVKIRWMGLFDTVASEGLPNNINLGYDLGIPSGTGAVLHLTAGSERRRTRFALTSINAGPLLPNPNPNYREEEMPNAVHSDVGGFYGKNRGLANQALIHMWWDGLNHGVPFGAIRSKYLNTTPNGPNDSRWPDDKFVELFTGPRDRKNYYSP